MQQTLQQLAEERQRVLDYERDIHLFGPNEPPNYFAILDRVNQGTMTDAPAYRRPSTSSSSDDVRRPGNRRPVVISSSESSPERAGNRRTRPITSSSSEPTSTSPVRSRPRRSTGRPSYRDRGSSLEDDAGRSFRRR